MSIDNRNAQAQERTDRPMNPGDEAPPGTAGTGETLCPECAGTGRKGAAPCRNCDGTGKVIQGIGGA